MIQFRKVDPTEVVSRAEITRRHYAEAMAAYQTNPTEVNGAHLGATRVSYSDAFKDLERAAKKDSGARRVLGNIETYGPHV